MGLEVATYVSQLVVTNPVVGDPVKEGDDHLRLIKTTLQNTFPNSSKALYFPTSVAEQTSTVNVAAADAGKVYPVSADAASRTVNLPAAPPDGFEVTIVKVDASANTVTIEPPGAVEINDELNIVLDTEFESARCIYMSTFGAWVAQRSAKGVPFDSDQEAAKVWPIANGGTGQTTAGAAFDALSPTADSEASAATLDLDVATSSYVFVTGTTTITAITLAAGRKRWVTFTGALTLTHGASLILPSFANILTVAGDAALFVGEAAGVVRCLHYQRSSTGKPVIPFGPARAYDEYTDNTDITTAIPYDDTIPQVGEGVEILSAAITLNRSDSRVRVRFQGFGTSTTAADDDVRPFTAALFVDGAANAVAAVSSGYVINNQVSGGQNLGAAAVVLDYEHAPGSVGPITYSIRVGPTSGETLRLNGEPNGRRYGGAARATLIVEEVFVA